LSVLLAHGSADDSWHATTPSCRPCPDRLGCARFDGGSGSLPLLFVAVDRRPRIVPVVPSISIRSDCDLPAFGPVANPAVLPGTVPTPDRRRRQLRLFNFTGYWLLTTILPSHAPRRDQRGQIVRKPFPAGCCLTPTAELAKTERGPIATSGPFISVWHQTGRSLRKNQSVFPRLPPLDRRPFSRGRRRSTPVAPGMPAGWP